MKSAVLATGDGSYDEFRLDDALEFAYGVDQFSYVVADAFNGDHHGRSIFIERKAAHPQSPGNGIIEDFIEFGFYSGTV